MAVIDDKNRMEPDIMNSSLDWTIIRCTTIKTAPAKKRTIASLDGKRISFSITDKDMADFAVSQLTDNTYLKQAPVISN